MTAETKDYRADAYADAWRALIEADGIGPNRRRVVLTLDPECGDRSCSWFDAASGHCVFLDDLPWTRGACRLRLTRVDVREASP